MYYVGLRYEIPYKCKGFYHSFTYSVVGVMIDDYNDSDNDNRIIIFINIQPHRFTKND